MYATPSHKWLSKAQENFPKWAILSEIIQLCLHTFKYITSCFSTPSNVFLSLHGSYVSKAVNIGVKTNIKVGNHTILGPVAYWNSGRTKARWEVALHKQLTVSLVSSKRHLSAIVHRAMIASVCRPTAPLHQLLQPGRSHSLPPHTKPLFCFC